MQSLHAPGIFTRQVLSVTGRASVTIDVLTILIITLFCSDAFILFILNLVEKYSPNNISILKVLVHQCEIVSS